MSQLTHTIVIIEGNSFDPDVIPGALAEADARHTAALLNADERELAKAEARAVIGRFQAVRTLASVDRSTQASDLTVADVRWLAGECADLDFFLAAPDWAKAAIDSVADRRNFTPKWIGHVLAAIRCIKSVNRQMERQVSRHEAAIANRGGRH